MTDLTAYITTFNCARTLPSTSHLASSLFSNANSTLPPDLIVLCLQEIAPIGYSFLGGSFLAPYFSRFSAVVQHAVAQKFDTGVDYSTLLVRNAGMTALMVFAREGIEERVKWVETAGVGVGLWDMGNKGAVGARLGVEGRGGETVPVTFVAAHLAPMEGEWERRNQDWKSICEGLVFTRDQLAPVRKGGTEAQPLLGDTSTESADSSGEHGLFSPLSHIFFAGDLNYRTSDVAPKETDHKTWPHPSSSSDLTTYSELKARDQLTRELNAKKTLHMLAEEKVTFPPTYKYSSAAQQQAADRKPIEHPHDTDSGAWAKHRVPSWCDRILYLASSPPKVDSYTALAVQPTSDHRPVAMSVGIALQRPEGANEVKPPFRIQRGWRERRAAARRLEVLVGIASYLALTWEGEALLLGTVVGLLGGYVALRALIGV